MTPGQDDPDLPTAMPSTGRGRHCHSKIRKLPWRRAGRAALILEVEYMEGDVTMAILHTMPARDKYLR